MKRPVLVKIVESDEVLRVEWQDRCENAAHKRIRGHAPVSYHPHRCAVCGAEIGPCCALRIWVPDIDDYIWCCQGGARYLGQFMGRGGDEVSVLRYCATEYIEAAERQRLRTKTPLGKR